MVDGSLVVPYVVGIAGGYVLTRLVWILFDRRRRWRAGKRLSPPWIDSYVILDLDLPSDRVDAIASEARARCGSGAAPAPGSRRS